MLSHILLLLLSAAVIWLLSGLLIDAVDRVARRFEKPGFMVAFFVLGLLTSISEISVAVNATLRGAPEVSAGNLLGASLVIFLLLIPLLAVLGRGIPPQHALSLPALALLLFIVMVPSVMALDGMFIRREGTVMLLLYGSLVYVLQKKRSVEETVERVIEQTEEELLHARHATRLDILKITFGALCIFVAGNVLVQESIAIAAILRIPASFMGLLLLSLGTNVPELVIAVRSLLRRRQDIAIGDYLGSAAANTLVFGCLVLVNGTFAIDVSEMLLTCAVFLIGFTLFFLFTKSKAQLSRKEGLVLLALYAVFLLMQVGNAVRLAGQGKLKGAAPDYGDVRIDE